MAPYEEEIKPETSLVNMIVMVASFIVIAAFVVCIVQLYNKHNDVGPSQTTIARPSYEQRSLKGSNSDRQAIAEKQSPRASNSRVPLKSDCRVQAIPIGDRD